MGSESYNINAILQEYHDNKDFKIESKTLAQMNMNLNQLILILR